MLAKLSMTFALCLLVSACTSSEQPKKAAVVPMPPPVVTQAWLDEYEPLVKQAIAGSHFELHRSENVLMVTAPVQGSFNPDRPHMMLPVVLGPLTRIAKLLETDEKMAVLVLGHADSSGVAAQNRELSDQRARAVTSIFRLSGLQSNRLMVKGLGSDMPRAANDSAEGRALNRRVEIVLTGKDTMAALVSKYSTPAPAAIAASTDKPAADKQLVAADQAK
jgi:outer membrane protein OmpA-like peptidoglycan-associated protein